MAKAIIRCILFAIALALSACSNSGPDFEEGEWEITVNFDIPGMPMKMPPNVYTQCLKRNNPLPKSEKPNQTCTNTNVITVGNTVTWTATCTNRSGKMTGIGEITYQKEAMSGTMTMEIQQAKMVSHFKGHRIRACKSE